MAVVKGFEILTATYLGEDWKAFGASAYEAIGNYAQNHHEDIAIAIAGFEELLASSMSEQEYYDRWVYGLDSGYDPREDGMTFREFFTHALTLLRAHGGADSD